MIVPRSRPIVTAVSLGPLIRAVAWSTVLPSSVVPFTETITSPGWTPAASAGDPGIGCTTASSQPLPIAVHEVPALGSIG